MSEQRRYSVAEIDEMRQALKQILTPWNVPYRQAEVDTKIEAQLRTHMLNGTDPAELREAGEEAVRREIANGAAIERFWAEWKEFEEGHKFTGGGTR